ncbi:MAG: hypothetical protein AB7K24_33185, partial [Gemmataceae bacterium]
MSMRHWFAVLLCLGLVGPATLGQDKDNAKKDKDKAVKKDEVKKDKDNAKKDKDDAKKDKDKDKDKDKGKDDTGTADLKWKFKKGETFYQEMTTDTKQTMKVSGMDITQNQKQTFYFSWNVKDEKDGNWSVEQKIIGAKMDINIGGQPITF